MNYILKEDFDTILQSSINFSRFQNSSFLITGSTGLIGSLLIKFLLYCSEIYSLNIRIYALIRNEIKANKVFAEEMNKNNLIFVKGDLLKERLSFDFSADYVIHTAAITASKDMVARPIETIQTSLMGIQTILDYSVKCQPKSVVYLSSMEVYGQVKGDQKVKENQLGFIDLSDVRSSYPESKRMCECMCLAYSREKNVNVKSIRLAQTFGAGISKEENRVFAQFARSALKHEDIILHTAGNSEGNYVYTADAIGAILLILLEGSSGESYNVSNEKSHMKIKEMAHLVAKVLGDGKCQVLYDIPTDSLKYGFAPDTQLFLDSSKTLKLGWKPYFDLEESYLRLAKWMKYNEIM